MILAQELRIGNRVLYTDCIGSKREGVVTKVVANGEESFAEADYHWRELSPIPLTEEVLIRAGFFAMARGHYMFPLEGESIIVLPKEGQCFLGSQTKGSRNFPIKYLHHLQNIFYFLSGEELTL